MSDSQAPVTVVHCWSAPRSRSTALLYSFEARGRAASPSGTDTTSTPTYATYAVDEPLYRRWLIDKGDAVSRPYTQQMIDGVPPGSRDDDDDDDDGKKTATPTTTARTPEEDAKRWARETGSLAHRIATGAKTVGPGGAVFCKHMAKHCHLYDFDNECEVGAEDTVFDHMADARVHLTFVHKHVLLIRDPVAVLSSWDVAGSVHGNNPTPDEVGIIPMMGIYSTLISRNGGSGSGENFVVILDSDQLARYPFPTLKALCGDLGIPFTADMLEWESGPHDCDGPWADWWYSDVHKSSGWFGHDMDAESAEDDDENRTTYPLSYVPPSRSYRTLNPSLVPTLRASLPAYDYLRSLTSGHKSRGPPASQVYEDPRNEHILAWIGAPGRGRLVPRDTASVSPWDSSVQGGDAAWEGLRVYNGKIFKLERHLKRLFKSAKALGFENVHTKEEVIDAIFRTLAANGMRDGAHIRLTLTRGEKCTSSMNPKFNVYGTTLIVLAEWKPTEGATTYDNTKGITLITASTRRNSPSTVDSKIHHNNMINNILPKIEANLAGAADAIMLDLDGFVSETNATNIFMVDDGILMTPHADACLPGITRETVIMLAKEVGIPCEIRRISLAEFHAADEVFTTGTMGELTPVTMIDGRVIGTGSRGPVTAALQGAYKTLPNRPGWATEIPPFSNSRTLEIL